MPLLLREHEQRNGTSQLETPLRLPARRDDNEEYLGRGEVRMKCIVELFGDDRNGRKMIAWGKRIGCADAGRVCDAERRKIAQTFRPRFHSPRRFAILVSAMLRQSFTDFIFATNTDGSGKAASYVRALDIQGTKL